MIRRLFAALLLLGAASMSHAVLVDLKSAAWQVYGTASPSTGSFGDAIGYDRSDSDRDGNPYARWFNSDQGVDYDEAVTATPFTPPMRITFNGCFPATRYGYNRIVVGEKNTAFTNATNAGAIFCVLDDALKRAERGLDINKIAADVRKKLATIEDAASFVFIPPPVRGLGVVAESAAGH